MRNARCGSLPPQRSRRIGESGRLSVAICVQQSRKSVLMLKHRNLAVAALWLTVLCAAAHAEDKNCDASLFKYVASGTINKEDMVHFYDLVNRENYDESKHNAGESHAGVFG